MSTSPQPQKGTPLILPTTIKYEIVWQQSPLGHSEPGKGNIIITVTDITIIAKSSDSPNPQYTAIAKLTWGLWEANFGCTYYPNHSIFLGFKLLKMNDSMRNEMQGGGLDSDEEKEEGSDDAKPKIHTAAADDHHNWMLRVEVEVEVGDNANTKDVSYQTGRVKLWAKRVVGDEETKLSRAEKDRLQIDSEGSS